MEQKERYIDATKLSLEEWLVLVFAPPSNTVFDSCFFPTDKQKNEYISSIKLRTEEEVIALIKKFIISSGSLGCDDNHYEWIEHCRKQKKKIFKELMKTQYNQRLVMYKSGFKQTYPWEGITWILDLLPYEPRYALEGLNAYFLAHIQFLPDGRFDGLGDAMELIRAKFIGLPNNNIEAVKKLFELKSREFECLVERLYSSMEYETILTREKKDGGRDIIATNRVTSKLEHLRIECKKYSSNVGLAIIQRLLGVVADEKVNKGVLVTTSGFSSPAKKFAINNPKIELINGDQLVRLLNEHLGTNWFLRIETLVEESLSHNKFLKTV